MTKPAIGYVGTGLMGLPMTQRLIERGYRVKAYDIAKDKLDAAVKAGASAATSPADATRGADLVLLNLPTTDAVETAVFGPDGVASALRKPQILLHHQGREGKSFRGTALKRDRMRMDRRAGIGRAARLGYRNADGNGRRQ
jgi:3-hydroxyisobutyrate dehydrogenase